MNRNSLVFSVLMVVSSLVWANDQRRLLIDPEQPDTNDTISVTITNSACQFYDFQTWEAGREIQITLDSSFLEFTEQCLKENPDAPDISFTVGPLSEGDWKLVLVQYIGGFVQGLVDVRSLSVSQALPSLSEGGINGLYYNPEFNGHYVNILEFDYGTLIIWPTFDPDGNQALVYAVGELTGNNTQVLDARAWIKVGGSVSLDGDFEPAGDEPWGTLSVEMQDCFKGVFRFDSERPEFGSGELELRRLAFVKQLGCTEE